MTKTTVSALPPPPEGWPRISAALYYDDASAAIDWLVRVYGFEVRLRIEGEGGRIEHSELEFGEGLVMVSQAKPDRPGRDHCTSPRSLGGANTQCLCVVVPDVDAHCAKARAEGATIVQEPETHDYGEDYWADRTYETIDCEGHHWWFLTRVRNPGQRVA